ncbi:MAG: hypothetical protein R6U91_04600 [Bacillota bacterium]
MKCPLRNDSEGNTLSCFKEECAWWVEDADIEGQERPGACAMLEIAVNGIIITVGEDEAEDEE